MFKLLGKVVHNDQVCENEGVRKYVYKTGTFTTLERSKKLIHLEKNYATEKSA